MKRNTRFFQPDSRFFNNIILRQRWMVFPVGIALALIMEFTEHRSGGGIEFGWHFTFELLFFGIIGPALIWLALSEIAVFFELTPPIATIQAEATRAERKRISRELHDRLSQNLAFLHLKLDQLAGAEDISPENIETIQNDLEQMRQLAFQAYEEVRNTLDNLRQPIPVAPIDNLKNALLAEQSRFAGQSPTTITIHYPDDAPKVCPLIEHTILEVTGEALANIHKHAHAAHATVSLAFTAADIVLRITDDGAGFVPNAQTLPAERHYGLNIMQERVRQVGGTFDLHSAPGKGTEITVRFANALVSSALHHSCNSINCEHLAQNRYEHSFS